MLTTFQRPTNMAQAMMNAGAKVMVKEGIKPDKIALDKRMPWPVRRVLLADKPPMVVERSGLWLK